MSNNMSKIKFNIIIGNPVKQSLSPLIHNFVYQKIGIENQFKFIKKLLEIEDLEDFVKNGDFQNLTVTIPFKEKIIPLLDKIDPVADEIQAVNTVVKTKNHNNQNILVGYNTDWLGGLIPIYQKICNKKFDFNFNSNLEKIIESQFLKDQKTVLFGAGGAGRALGYAVLKVGSQLVIANRTLSKSQKLKEELKLIFPKASITVVDNQGQLLANELEQAKIIINSTPLGMLKLQDMSPLDVVTKKWENSNQPIFFDAVYKPLETKFLKQAKDKNAEIINGLEMLMWQAVFQFQLQTKQYADIGFFQQSLFSSDF